MSDKLDFADLKFKIECGRMVLAQGGNIPHVVSGPGEIWQDAEGVLQFKIFTDQTGYRALRLYVSRPGVIGQLIPDDEFFVLRAEDYTFPIWTADRIIPSYRGGFDCGLAHGYLQELVHSTPIPQNLEHDFVQLRIKGKLKIPWNQFTSIETSVGGQVRNTANSLNAALVEDGDFHFEFRHEREHTVVSLRLPAGQLTSATPMRILEALQFVMGRQLAILMIETSSNCQQITRLTSPERGFGKIQPPLNLSPTDLGDDFWRMFISYFRHVHPNTNPGWHPISCHVASVIESSAASLEVQILSLAVAVEGLAGECFPNLAPVNPALLAELDVVQAALQSMTLGEHSRNRINGSINAMRSPRNSDIIRAFIANSRLANGLFNSWSRLRNASAHGDGTAGRNAETILRLRSEVLSLFYSFIFAAINYSGPRTDYSQRGWPTQGWPVPHPSEAVPSPVVTPTPSERTVSNLSNV